MLKKGLDITLFALVMSVLNLLFFHIPFLKYVMENLDAHSFGGALFLVVIVLMIILANALVYYLVFSLSRRLGKVLLSVTFIISAFCLYFINTFSVIMEESMLGNLFNTKYSEASSFLSFKMLLYFILLGVLPSVGIFMVKIIKDNWRKVAIKSVSCLAVIAVVIFSTSSHWLWIDKHSKELGGLLMPWSYIVNSARFFIHKHQNSMKEILLPDAKFKDDSKSVMVLVIGESARRANFSLYGYPRNTNPLLSSTDNIHCYEANSAATYTTAGVRRILEHVDDRRLYEILPNYVYRSGGDVQWKSSNWGEPPLHISDVKYLNELAKDCKGENCEFDETLVEGIKERVLNSDKNKVLIIIHLSTSHGPSYYKKYPPRFEVFSPVCTTVELSKATPQELYNAYDNTIVYTDYILHRVIEQLNELDGYKKSMIFVSDHGESLGEKKLYMHGLPMSVAPKEQYEIPFIVWSPDREVKSLKTVSQGYVYHSVMNFLALDSPVYNEELNIFQ